MGEGFAVFIGTKRGIRKGISSAATEKPTFARFLGERPDPDEYASVEPFLCATHKK